jgi:hypothetical protein
VELGRLFSNHCEILTLPQILFGYIPRRGRTYGTEVVRAHLSLVARTGRVEHSLDAIVDEMSVLGSPYSKGMVRRIINDDLSGLHTLGHVSRALVIRSATGYRLRDGATN